MTVPHTDCTITDCTDLVEQGIDLYPGTAVLGFDGDKRAETVGLADKTVAAVAIVGVGVKPNAEFSEAIHIVTGGPDYVPLALTINRTGRAIERYCTTAISVRCHTTSRQSKQNCAEPFSSPSGTLHDDRDLLGLNETNTRR